MLFVRPETVVEVGGGEPLTVVVPVDGLVVILYSVIGLPPSDGAVHDTVADALPATAVTFVGAAGAVGACGVTALDAEDDGPSPIPLVAKTLNVYDVPLDRGPTEVVVAGGEPVTVATTPPGVDVTVYFVIPLPFDGGADHETVA